MFLLKIEGDFRTTYYEYDNEKQVLEHARKVAREGIECTLLKPYKRFEVPKSQVQEVDI
jgi:hypothetical protein